MSGQLERLFDEIGHDLGWHDHNMQRDRPYTGQPHASTGERGKTEIRGITFRDLRDCYIRAVLLSAHHIAPTLYAEADKGETAALCENDLFGINLEEVDPLAIVQNLCCEVERIMGIFPNVPELKATGDA